MSLQQRVVQLSAASLALVFSKSEESCRAGVENHNVSSANGQEIFEDFKSQNMRSFWNKRLVKAVAAIYFQGWMENFVLLVQGTPNHLEVLREAWMRRALRSPNGFVIRAVGDLTPMQMAPIPQSQFIPLSEVLCSVISDMNAAHITVNQEALISHMTKAHPGMTIPTQDILYNALGTLIKERKIYHTGEGYFIVTPQTYFITNSPVKDKHRWPSAQNDPPSPPPITYLVSNESCMETGGEALGVAHCRSCSCFAAPFPSSIPDHRSISECTGKSLRGPRDHKPSVQHQSTSTAADYQPSETSKSAASRKDKDKEKAGRRFGLSLFRRHAGKKDKPKTEHTTFSGQFPPQEWPVRDEEDLNNLPRDLEHAIIKSINPKLTVDNLVRHTVLMTRMEGGVDRGMSTEILAPAQRHPPRVAGKRSASKAYRSKKRGHTSREKQAAKSEAFPHASDPPLDGVEPPLLRREYAVDELDRQEHEDRRPADSKNLYKRRIDNPFQGRLARDAAQGSGHRGQRKREGKGQASERRDRAGHRSKSWEPSRTKAGAAEQGRSLTAGDGSCEGLDRRGPTLDSSPEARHTKDLLGNYGSGYPESSTLRIEDKVKLPREGNIRGLRLRDETLTTVQDRGMTDASEHRRTTRQSTDTDFNANPSPPQTASEDDMLLTPPQLTKPTVQHRLSLSQRPSDCSTEVKQRPDYIPSQQQAAHSASRLAGSGQMESDGFTDDDEQTLHQGAQCNDACSSLYLNEDSMSNSSQSSQSGTIHCQASLSTEGAWDSAEVGERSTGEHGELALGHSSQSVPLQEPGQAMDTSFFTFCQTDRVGSTSEAVHKTGDGGVCRSPQWVVKPHSEDSLPGQFEKHQTLGCPHASNSSQTVPRPACVGENVENHSNTGDSGIDSPRAQLSLTSGSSEILAGLKRQTFLQNLEKLHTKNSGLRSQSSLLQLTTVMNV